MKNLYIRAKVVVAYPQTDVEFQFNHPNTLIVEAGECDGYKIMVGPTPKWVSVEEFKKHYIPMFTGNKQHDAGKRFLMLALCKVVKEAENKVSVVYPGSDKVEVVDRDVFHAHSRVVTEQEQKFLYGPDVVGKAIPKTRAVKKRVVKKKKASK